MACSIAGISKACCNLPAVQVDDYKPKGKYVDIHGMKTYVTGPENATKAILAIYDIFGFRSQTLQGADILSSKYLVIMPDFFDKDPMPLEWYPPATADIKAKVNDFFETKANIPKALQRIPGVIAESQKKYSTIESWGVLGYCWGGKISVLASSTPTQFKVGVQCHPAKVDSDDGKNVSIPYLSLPSKDEDAEQVKQFAANLEAKGTPHQVETYGNRAHGWMAARGDLHNEEELSDYKKGYQNVLDFLQKHF